MQRKEISKKTIQAVFEDYVESQPDGYLTFIEWLNEELTTNQALAAELSHDGDFAGEEAPLDPDWADRTVANFVANAIPVLHRTAEDLGGVHPGYAKIFGI